MTELFSICCESIMFILVAFSPRKGSLSLGFPLALESKEHPGIVWDSSYFPFFPFCKDNYRIFERIHFIIKSIKTANRIHLITQFRVPRRTANKIYFSPDSKMTSKNNQTDPIHSRIL